MPPNEIHMNEPCDKNRRVLVIDDNRSIHDDFRKILTPATATATALKAAAESLFGEAQESSQLTSFAVDSAYQGQEGALLVQKALQDGLPYGMAFVDVRMPPGWDGIETAQKIWAIDPDLQIVICTAYSDYSSGEIFEKLGRREGFLILKKPFDVLEALQLAHALTEKRWLHDQFRGKMEALEGMVADRTHEMEQANLALQAEVVERQRAGEALQLKTAFLEAQVNSSIDAIIVVDEKGKKILQNQRTTELFKIPPQIADDPDDQKQVRWVTSMTKNPEAFAEKVVFLYSHPNEISRDEIELTDGTIMDRYSCPVVGEDGRRYGRTWIFRDVTEQRRVEQELKQAKVAAVAREGMQRYNFLADTVPLIIWTARPDGNVDYYNKTWFDYTGLTLAQTRDWGWRAVLHPDDLQRCIDRWTQSFTTGENYEIEYRFKRALDGTYRWFLGRASACRNEDGQIVQWVGTCTDIDDQKRAEAELRQARSGLESKVAERTAELTESNAALQTENAERKRVEESLRLLNSAVEQANESILITDAQLDLPGPRILFVNPAFTKMTGYSAEEAIGKTPRILQGPRTDKAVLSRLRHNLQRGEAFAGEAINYRKDGSEFDLEWQVAPIRDASGIITHFVAIQHYITARAKAENALRESNEKFHLLADNITDVFWIRSPDMRQVHYVSPAFERIWGRPVESLYANPQQWADFILPEDRDRVVGAFAALKGEPPSLDIEYRIVRPGGEIRWMRARGFQVRDAADKLIRHIGIVTDITERKRFDAHLFQSQKLETVGKLAGGIAHEFNSILTAIIGHSDLLLQDFPAGSPFARNATEINEAARRAATLTRQLLAYGRKQILQPVILDLNLIITGMEVILRQIIGDEVNLHVIAAPGLHAVKADAGQIEQVIINLAVNGREAMPNGGKLTFETADVHFDQDGMGRDPELKPGHYVMLAITDTGAGMSAEVKARLFEPFFTTKAIGQGTGLGLSTCHGIVKQSGGHISVYSELGRGTTFKIYLPQVEQQAKFFIPRPDSQDLPRGTETILLVEDDPALLKLAVILLRRLGYTVLPAANGVEALSLRQKGRVGHIDLLFTDVVMPHMGGKELADRVRASFPHTRILFTSSYTEHAIVHQGVLDKGVALLQKPFTPSALARKVREVLDE